MRKARSRRGRAAFPKVGVAVMVELGLHNPLTGALFFKILLPLATFPSFSQFFQSSILPE
jgi:hypothetical protein